MAYTKQQLNAIYRRTTGYCHLCHRKLSRKSYGILGARAAWHVEHSKARANGGSDHTNNLFAACIRCNCKKGNRTTRTSRRWNGKTAAPLNPEQRKQAKAENGVAGAIAGGLAGAAMGGPIGFVVGAVAGACIGSSKNPDRK